MLRFIKLAVGLCRSSIPPRMMTALSLLPVVALAGALTWYGVRSRETAVGSAQRELRQDASILAAEEDELLRAVDGAQLGLMEAMRRDGIDAPEKLEQSLGSAAVHQDLKDRIGGLAPAAALLLSDRRGKLLNSSSSRPAWPIGDADRDIFRDLGTAGTPQPLISAPCVNAATGEWPICLSRRFEAPDGRLMGFVVSPIRIDNFGKSFARLLPAGDASFALYRRDGTLITRYPPVDRNNNETPAAMPSFNRPPGSPGGDVNQNSGLPSFLVTGQIGHGQLRLVSPASLLISPSNNSCLHRAVPCNASTRLSFRFSRSELTN